MERFANFTLHRAYQIGIALKGLDGLLEVIGGVALLLVSQAVLWHFVTGLTGVELSENPHDFISTALVHWKHHFSAGAQQFAAIYLLAHGFIKVGLVAGLVLRLRAAYPAAVCLLSAFIAYQIYHLARSPSIALSIFTIIDIVIVVLIWREWRRVARTHATRLCQ